MPLDITLLDNAVITAPNTILLNHIASRCMVIPRSAGPNDGKDSNSSFADY
jgi:hypothetical protein